MKVIDNFLDKKDFENIRDVMMSPWFAWYYNDGVTYSNEKHKKNNFQFTHSFYYKNEKSNRFNLLQPLLNKLEPIVLARIKANLGTKTEKHIKFGYHVDYKDSKLTTAIFYLNDNNGYTEFKRGEKIKSKANRFVEFASDLFHQGVSQTDTKIRVAINFNYFKNVL